MGILPKNLPAFQKNGCPFYCSLVWHIQINATWSLSRSLSVLSPFHSLAFRRKNVNFFSISSSLSPFSFHFDNIDRETFLFHLNGWNESEEKKTTTRIKEQNKISCFNAYRIYFTIITIFFYPPNSHTPALRFISQWLNELKAQRKRKNIG